MDRVGQRQEILMKKHGKLRNTNRSTELGLVPRLDEGIQKKVNETLDAAVENGYMELIMHQTLMEVARDMTTYDADMEKLFAGNELALTGYIATWRVGKPCIA